MLTERRLSIPNCYNRGGSNHNPMLDLIGRQFGHIRVTEVVGEGGMGAVYAGYDEKLDRKVALKVLHSDQRLDLEARQRLLREARALSKVDHPNICRIHDYIETGDVDLLVLEYIDGRTLQSVIAEGLPYSERLRIAAAIAEVLVRAHRAGIVHRDLKPDNVMLTAAGEVKVLDFGLARWLQKKTGKSSDTHQAIEPSRPPMLLLREVPPAPSPAHIGDTMVLPAARPSDVFPSGRREFLATAAGIALGTPLYMSPEQARGEVLAPASDMFSFGLLLQVLFTGKEPHPELASAREVILRVARGETSPCLGASKDITALVNSLKQFAPADRPTAVQTAERLQFLITKPQRIARRAIAAVILAIMLFGAWRYTVDLKRERAIAIAERAEAQKQRANVEDLLGFMVGDLRRKLEPVGRLDVLDGVAEKALQYVEGLRPEAMSVDELARNAKALNQLGDVRIGQGKTAEALDLFSRSLKLIDVAVQREPKNPGALMVFGATHFYLGNTLRLQSKTDEALVHMQRYMQTGDTLAALDPNNEEYQLEKAYGHSGVGLILETKGELPLALEHYRVSLQVKEELSRRAPQNANAQAELARAYNKLGVALNKAGDLSGARSEFVREVAIYRALVARNPQQTQWKQRLSTSMAYLARALNDTSRHAEAYELWQEELAIERELAAHDPQNVDWQRNVGITLSRLSAAELHGDRPAEALRYSNEARAVIATAVRLSPDRVSFREDAIAIDVNHARVLAQMGNRAAAAGVLRNAVSAANALGAKALRRDYYLARASYDLGEVIETSDPAGARRAWETAERALEAHGQSASAETLELWTSILVRRGRVTDARLVRARLSAIGHSSPRLSSLCSRFGC